MSSKVKGVLGTVIPFVLIAGSLVWDFWPTEEDRKRAQMGEICEGLVVPCYVASDNWGNISGTVVADVTADGTVEGASYKGDAPEIVQQCLVAQAKQRSIEGYEGQPVAVECQYSGSITKGTQQMSTSWAMRAR
jgi:hypothetical protein